jgi:hypothetical protein
MILRRLFIVGMLWLAAGSAWAQAPSLVDDTAYSPNLTRFAPIGGEVDDSGTDTVGEGNAGAARITPQRGWHVNLRDNSGSELGVTASPLVVRIGDGTDLATVLNLAGEDPLAVAIVDGAGAQITSFGGGTQYTEGDTDATITGTAILWEDTGNTLRPVASGTPLPITCISGCGGSGGTASTDDAAFTAGSGSGTPMMGFATSDAVNTGDVGVLRMTATRDLMVTHVDLSGVNITSTASTALRVQLVAPNGDGDAPYDQDGSGMLIVNLVDPDGAVLSTTSQQMNVRVQGQVAHDAAISGNPVNIAGVASAAEPADVSADQDVARLWVLRSGLLPTTLRDGVGDSAMDDANDAVRVNVVAGSTAGVQYTEGDTDATITGTAILWEDTGNTLRPVAAGTPLPITCISGCGTQFAEDAGHTTGDLGTMILAVRADTDGTLAGANGDYAPLQVDANGYLKVNISQMPTVNSVLRTPAGDSAMDETNDAVRVSIVAGSTEYTVNAAAPADPIGGTFVMERDDALSALSEIEGDWTNPRSNANGALWVAHDGAVTIQDGGNIIDVQGTVSVTGVATSANQSTEITSLQLIDDLVTAEDQASANLDEGIVLLARRTASPANTSGADLDYEALQMSAGRLWTSTTIDAALPAGTNNIGDVDLASAIPAGTNNIGDVDIASAPTGASSITVQGTAAADAAAVGNPIYGGGRASAAAPTDVSADGDVVPAWHLRNGAVAVQPTFAGVLQSTGNGVAGTGTPRVTIASDNTAFTVNAAQATASSLNAEVQGDAAHDAAVSGNPVLQGGEARTSNGTAVANGDAVRSQHDVIGRQVVAPYTLYDNIVRGCGNATGTADTAVIAAAGAGIRNYVTTITVINTSSTSTYVTVKDGSTALLEIAAPASTASMGGAVVPLPVPLRTTANTAFNFASAAGVTTMRVCAVGFTAP